MNPLQQGLKHWLSLENTGLDPVAIMNPLQQGLKLWHPHEESEEGSLLQ